MSRKITVPEAAIIAYTEYMPREEIYRKFQVTHSTFFRALKRKGIGRERRGGSNLTQYGYVETWISLDDPLASMRRPNGRTLEHRLVMARHLGRPLENYETVHHINGDRTDNRLENLQLRFTGHGKGITLQCRKCGSNDLVAEELE